MTTVSESPARRFRHNTRPAPPAQPIPEVSKQFRLTDQVVLEWVEPTQLDQIWFNQELVWNYIARALYYDGTESSKLQSLKLEPKLKLQPRGQSTSSHSYLLDVIKWLRHHMRYANNTVEQKIASAALIVEKVFTLVRCSDDKLAEKLVTTNGESINE